MRKLLTAVWYWFTTDPKVRMRDMTAMERAYLFALLGTSKEDREWAQSGKNE